MPGARILLVEDDEVLRELILRNLEERGHDVRIAADAHAALAHLKATPFDLILLDICLPDQTGWEVLRTALAMVVMRAIRRDPARRYARMRDMLNDLQCLDTVTPVDYVPDRPKLGGRYRQAIRIALIVLAVRLLIIAFGFFAQVMHAFVS